MVLENKQTIELEIDRWMDYLHTRVKQLNATYGINKVVECASNGMAVKWASQMSKLNAAVTSSNLQEVMELVNGALRGLDILECEYVESGNSKIKPVWWDVIHPEGGSTYRIVRSSPEATSAKEDGVLVYTLDEVARILESHQLLNVIKDTFPESSVSKIKAPFKEDEIPW